MIEIVFALLADSIKLLAEKERKRYEDERMRLEREWRYELSKPVHDINDAAIDDIEFRLKQLCRARLATATKSTDT